MWATWEVDKIRPHLLHQQSSRRTSLGLDSSSVQLCSNSSSLLCYITTSQISIYCINWTKSATGKVQNGTQRRRQGLHRRAS